MKKAALILFLSVGISFLAYSQTDSIDVIYLHNGNIINGTIVEQYPDSSVKIKSIDGGNYFFNGTDIKRIAKEVKNEEDLESERRNRERIMAEENEKRAEDYKIAAAARESSKVVVPKKADFKRMSLMALSAGPSFNVGNTPDAFKNGFSGGLDLTTHFTKYIGFGGSLLFNHNKIDGNSYYAEKHERVNTFGLLMGIVLTTPISKYVFWDFKFMSGYCMEITAREAYSFLYTFNAGIGLRFNISPYVAFSVKADLILTEITEDYFFGAYQFIPVRAGFTFKL